MAAKGSDFSEMYEKMLQEAEVANLSRVSTSGCVTVGRDLQGHPVVSFIPTLGFDYGEKSEETLHLIYLLFIKLAHQVVTSGPFSIVYSRKTVDWRKPLVYDYYQMLPEREKKNLKKLYVINPQIGIRMFFAITRMFLSAEFYNKLVFVENIAAFQRTIPPKLLILPYNFLNMEDSEKGLKCSGVSVPLTLDYVPLFGTTSIMKRCTRFLRDNGGLKKTGLFRVAGNENQLSLVRVRLQPPIYFTKSQMRAYMNSIIVGLDDEDYRANERNGLSVRVKSTDASLMDDISYHLSTVVIMDIESVAQTLKLSLRDLPEPLFTFKAFDILMYITQVLDRKQCTLEKWHEGAANVIKDMPVEHRSTLCFLLDFLREVAAECKSNQMDVHNLSTIFAPTLLRPAKPDFTNPAKAFNEVRLCQLVIKHLLDIEPARRILGVSTLVDVSEDSAKLKTDTQAHKPMPATSESDQSLNIEAALNLKMKNRVTSVLRPNRFQVSDESNGASSSDDSDLIMAMNSRPNANQRSLSDSSVTSPSRASLGIANRPQSSASNSGAFKRLQNEDLAHETE